MDYNFPISDCSIQEANIRLSNAFRTLLYGLIEDNAPHYLTVTPFLRGRSTKLYLSKDMMIFMASYDLHMNAVIVGSISDTALIEDASNLLTETEFPSFLQLHSKYSEQYFSENAFLIVSPVSNGSISSQHFEQVLLDWVNEVMFPKILEDNKQRVIDAIPTAPQYNIENVFDNVFVLEDTSDCFEDVGTQGTCFYLKETGFITCDHVLTAGIKCFHPKKFDKRYDVEVIARNRALDLAILKIDQLVMDYNLDGLECGQADLLHQMDHIAVAGFPNYRPGDTGILSPGLVIGFRPTHGIRRLLVNAAIVNGNSGGPVFDANNQVVGVAVTGADCSEEIMNTENHGVIPIEALSFLS